MKKRNLLLMLLLAIGLPWAANAQQALPYSYGFEDNDLSVDGWTLYGSTSSSTKIYSETDAPEGSYLFKFQWTEQNAHLVSPLLSGTENGVDVTFQYMRNTSSSSYNEKFQVGYTTDETVTDPTQFTYGNEVVSGTQWLTYENTFPAGTKRIAIKYIYINGYYLRLDDFHFNAAASCAKPTNLECTAYTATTATLGWTENGTATNWVIEYGTASDFTGATSVPVSDNPHTLTGLTAETTYYARVKADCGGGDQSAWSNTCEFKPSAVVTTCEDFEGVTGTSYSTEGSMPEGWFSYTTATGSYIVAPHVCSGSSYNYYNSGSQSLVFESGTNANSNNAYVVMPANTSGEYSSLTFYTRHENTGYGTLQVGYVTAQTEAACGDFVSLTSITPSTTLHQETIDITSVPSDAFIAFKWQVTNSTYYACGIDDVCIGILATNTPKPRNLVVSDITSEGATVTWTAPADNVTGYQYQYKYATTPTWPDSWNSLAANVTTKDLVALAANTLYDFRVRANYAEGDSDPAEIQFTTLVSCLPPTGLDVANITANSATLLWASLGSGISPVWEVCLYPTNDIPQELVYTETTNINSYSSDHLYPVAEGGLTPNTDYTFFLRRKCSADDVSETAEIQFTTLASCLPPTGLDVANITANSATLLWASLGSGISPVWEVCLYPTNDIPQELVYTETTNINSYSSDRLYPVAEGGLTPNTDYTFFLRRKCSADDVSETASISFRTACGAITSFPITYGFETSEGFPANASTPTVNPFDACWRNEATVQNGTYPTRVWGTSTSIKHNGSQALVLPDKGNSTNFAKTMLVFPEMEFTSANGYTVSFWIYRSGTGSNPEGFKLYVSDCDTIGPNAVELGHYSRYYSIAYPVVESASGWYQYETAPITRTGSVYLIFEGQSYYGSATYVDDITIKEYVVVTANQIVNTVSDPATEMTWNEFVSHWNNGDHFTHSTFELKGDIASNSDPITTMVGTQDRPFTGVFDGKGYSINAMDIESDEAGAAPFHYISNATIKNLGVNGNVTQTNTTDGGYHTAGLVGFAWSGTNTIENCGVNTSITITTLGGGIVGHAKSSTLYLTGCYYGGGIENTTPSTDANRGVGGLVGWCDNATLYIKNCVYEGINGYSGDGSSVYFHPVACKTGGATVTAYVSNCYYLCDEPAADTDGANNVATTEGRKAYKVTGAEGITVDLPSAAIHYTCSSIWGDNTGSWNGIKFGSDIYGGEGKTLTLNLRGANGYAADHGTLTPSDGQYTLLMEAYDTQISGVDCPVPYGVTVPAADITANSALVTWIGTSDSYTVEYGELVESPTTYDFEDNAIPDGFTNDATYPWVIAESGHGGSYSIKSGNNGYHSTTSSIEMPVVLTSDGTLSFYCLASCESASSYWDFGIFYIDGEQQDRFLNVTEWQYKTYELAAGTHTLKWTFSKDGSGEDGDDCFYVDDITITNWAVETWTEIANITELHYTIDNLTPETSYQVRVKGICGGTETDYSDAVSFTTLEACSTPSEFTVGEVTAHTAAISWNGGNAESWTVFVKKSTETDYPASGYEVNTPAKTLESLDAATTYDVKIVAGCDDTKVLEVAEAFTTECDVITDLPWNENFDTYTGSTNTLVPTGFPNDELPMCWQFLNRSDNSNIYPLVFISSNSGYPVSGNCLFFKSSSTTPLYAVLPAFEEEIAGLQLTFTYRNEGTSDYNGTLIVGYMTDPADANTFTTVLTCERTTTLTVKDVLFNNAPAGSYIAFKYQGGSSNNYYLSIDNVKVDVIPTCAKPTDLTFMNSTTTTATLSWTAGADETAWQICINGDETNLIDADSNPFTIENLTAATNYTAKVRAYCSADDQSDWSNEVRFVTECDVFVVDAAHPYTQGFEDSDDIPVCWETIPTTYDGSEHDWQIDDYYNHSGEKSASSEYYGPIYLIMPDLQLANGTAAQLTFWSYNIFVTDYDKNSVVLLDGENEIELWSPESVVEDWEETTIDLTAYMGQTISLAFKYEGDNAHGWYIDDVKVEVLPFTKTIAAVGEEGWANGKGGYYFIASPVAEPVTPTADNGFIVGDYDLYYFSQACDGEGNEWINFKDETLGGYNLTNGKGYLYASKEGTTLTFTGAPGTTGIVPLDNYDGNARFKGWNLIGNPFAQDAYINKPFYTLENSDTYTNNEAGTPIHAMQGVLIIADEDETTVTFTTEAPAVNNGKLNMNLRSNNKQLDNAILVFGGEQQLGKISFREGSSKVYMPVEGKDYAITSVEGQVGEVPVSFKAENNGTYSLSFTSEEVSFSYLHLIDNMTGADVDLLANPTYSFDASTSDYESRFRLMFATGSSANDDTFGFVNASGNFCIFGIEGEATVQVIDVLGHVISSETFSGSYEKRINGAPGVYMVRLIQGNDVKVQKVVVR